MKTASQTEADLQKAELYYQFRQAESNIASQRSFLKEQATTTATHLEQQQHGITQRVTELQSSSFRLNRKPVHHDFLNRLCVLSFIP